MLQEVDDAIAAMLRARCGIARQVEISFEAPTREWSARRSAPVVDVFLYDIRESLDRRHTLLENVRENERVVGQVLPTRWFACAYLVTAWTQRPEDEHRLLGSIIEGLLTVHAIPRDCLSGRLAEIERQFFLTLARPLVQERSISDIWSALGGELKPSLDLVVFVPVEPRELREVGPPVLEAPSLFVSDGHSPPDERRTIGHRRAKADPDQQRTSDGLGAESQAPTPATIEEVVGGSEARPGRRFRFAVEEGPRTPNQSLEEARRTSPGKPSASAAEKGRPRTTDAKTGPSKKP